MRKHRIQTAIEIAVLWGLASVRVWAYGAM